MKPTVLLKPAFTSAEFLSDTALRPPWPGHRLQLRKAGEGPVAGRTSVGLDIGTSGVRAAELSLGKHGATLERFGQVALPPGAVRDGEVVDVDAVAEAIKHLWQTVKFGSKKVVLG